MDMRQITYFMRVFEERSFTRAAERIHVVQPALSRQIALLEGELNAKLFVRGSQGVEPTAAASKLYEGVLPIVGMLAKVKAEIRSLASEKVTGKFSCGFPPNFSGAFVGKIIPKFVEMYPDVQLQVVEDFSGSLTEYVRNGSLDFALGTVPPEPSGLASEFVYSDDIALISGEAVCGPSFRPCRLDQIPDLKIIIASERNAMAQQLRHLIASGLVTPSQVLQVDSASAIRDLIYTNGWSALAPLCAVVNHRAAGRQLYIYPIEYPQVSYRLGLIRRQDRPLNAASEIFLSMIRELVDQTKPTWASVAALFEQGR